MWSTAPTRVPAAILPRGGRQLALRGAGDRICVFREHDQVYKSTEAALEATRKANHHRVAAVPVVAWSGTVRRPECPLLNCARLLGEKGEDLGAQAGGVFGGAPHDRTACTHFLGAPQGRPLLLNAPSMFKSRCRGGQWWPLPPQFVSSPPLLLRGTLGPRASGRSPVVRCPSGCSNAPPVAPRRRPPSRTPRTSPAATMAPPFVSSTPTPPPPPPSQCRKLSTKATMPHSRCTDLPKDHADPAAAGT